MADQRTSTKSNRPNSERSSRAAAPKAAPARRPGAGRIAGDAAGQLAELVGKELEGITGIERTDDGWIVEIDVLELRRIPGTTDVLATYEVEMGTDGQLEGYRRLNRFVRGETSRDRRE